MIWNLIYYAMQLQNALNWVCSAHVAATSNTIQNCNQRYVLCQLGIPAASTGARIVIRVPIWQRWLASVLLHRSHSEGKNQLKVHWMAVRRIIRDFFQYVQFTKNNAVGNSVTTFNVNSVWNVRPLWACPLGRTTPQTLTNLSLLLIWQHRLLFRYIINTMRINHILWWGQEKK